MRRVSRGKQRKSDVANSDGEEEVSDSVKADNDETGSGNDVEASNSSGKKRTVRGRVKTSEEPLENDQEEAEQENGKPPSKRRKKDNDESVENDSDRELEKLVNKKNKQDKDSISNNEDEKNDTQENGKSPAKSKKKTKPVQKAKDSDDGEEYEVEKVVDQRTIKGRRQFLVRWKGYTAEHDTWEQEKELNCDKLIEEFLAEQEENNESFEKEEEKTEKRTKGKKQDKKSTKAKRNSKVKDGEVKESKNKRDEKGDDGDNDDADDSTEYEVEKIIEVHFKKDKTREFLIRWKGFSSNDDTWEPEEHLNCPELINKFMEKLEKIKSTDARELRANPLHTKRYTLNMHASKRHSRRNANKERVTYHDYEA